MSERKGHVDLIVGVLASFVGLLALAVAFYGVTLQRQQVRAQVWPRLQVWNTNVDGVKIHIENVGVGPAEIRAVAVTIDGKPYPSWKLAVPALIHKDMSLVYSYLHGRVVAPGTGTDILSGADAEVGAAIMKNRERLEFEICYCSVLSECWRMGAEHDGVLTGCPQPAVPFED